MNIDSWNKKIESNIEGVSQKVAIVKIIRAATGVALLNAKWLVDDNPEVINDVIKLEELISMVNHRKNYVK